MQIPITWLYFLIGSILSFFIFILIALLFYRRKKHQFNEQLNDLHNNHDSERSEWDNNRQYLEKIQKEVETKLHDALHENAALGEKSKYLSSLEQEYKTLKNLSEQFRNSNVILEKSISEMNARYEDLQEHVHHIKEGYSSRNEKLETLLRGRDQVIEKRNDHIVQIEKKISQLQTQMDEFKKIRLSMSQEFKLLASQIMKENSMQFGTLSQEKVEQVLKPLQNQVLEFRKRLEEVRTDETKEMASLMHEIKSLKELNLKISEDAVSLTKALRGETKQQGIWGEVVLERVLEASGLRKGEEYEREVSLNDDENRRYRPDVIVHLPDERDIIIDAKTSLLAYEKYINAETDTEKNRYAIEHLQSVKRHIDLLSEKSYTQLEGLNTLDFVFLFMPIEGALLLALQTDTTLYDKAFGKHIVLVSPTTLLVALRAVENTWRRDRQNRNALEIARRAGLLYDKFVGFAKDMERIGRQLDTVQKSHHNAWNKLKDGRGNIVHQIEELRELGARASKQMPKRLVAEKLPPLDPSDQ